MSDVKRYTGREVRKSIHSLTEVVLATDYDQLASERDALKADAERYRWLFDEESGTVTGRFNTAWRMWNGEDGVRGFGATIDAAIQGK